MTGQRPVTVYFVRHAESLNNVGHMSGDPDYEREPDPEITQLGRDQAACTAKFFSEFPIDAVFISPMLRCLQTARPLLELLPASTRVSVHSDIHEEGGVFRGHRCDGHSTPHVHGLSRLEINSVLENENISFFGSAFSSDCFHQTSSGWWAGGLETEEAVSARADRFIEFLLEYLSEASSTVNTVVIYTHGLFIDSLVCKFLKLVNREQSHRNLVSPIFLSGNCSLTVLHVYQDKSVAVAGLNCADHLPLELRTGHSIGKKYKCDRRRLFP